MARRPIKGRIPPTVDPIRANVTTLPPPKISREELFGADEALGYETPLIANNRTAIDREFFRRRSPATKRNRKAFLKLVTLLVERFNKTSNLPVLAARNINGRFTSFMSRELEGNKDRLRLFNRLLRCLGVSSEFEVPVLTDRTEPEPSDTLSDTELAGIIRCIRVETAIIKRRLRERDAAIGADPRSKAGGTGGWNVLANRIWAVKNILRLEIAPWNEINAQHPTLVKQLQDREGAMGFTPDGTPRTREGTAAGEAQHPPTRAAIRLSGLNGHLRYFYPTGRDLAPFALNVMGRTKFNLSTASRLKKGEWHVPYPFSTPPGTKGGCVYIVGPKSRGKQNAGDPDKIVRAISLVNPSTHAYKTLEFVEILTQPARDEICRQISVLERRKNLDTKERSLLEYYRKIKDYLFVYWENGRFYAMWNKHGAAPNWLRYALESYGAPTKVKMLRDTGLNFVLSAPGGSAQILALLASHSERILAYETRKKFLAEAERAVAAIFEHSIALSTDGRFTTRNIKKLLANQGFSVTQIVNLLDEENTTRWGNRCASPDLPPEDFAEHGVNGRGCVTQRCIDGCPMARWFEESIPFVQRLRAERERELSHLGLEATLGSSHDRRLRALDELLRLWPTEVVAKYSVPEVRE